MSLFNSRQTKSRAKPSVFGYIRKHQSAESINIPLLVSYKCLEYYFVDEFISKARNDYFSISNDKMMVTNIGGHIDEGAHTIYCNQWIKTSSKVIAKWTFFIKNGGKLMYFGLASNDEAINEDFYIEPIYQISSDGNKWSHESVHELEIEDVKWECNDTITFILDLSTTHGIFSMKIDDKEVIVIFNHVERGDDIQYKMAIKLENLNRHCAFN
eukprot:452487_1